MPIRLMNSKCCSTDASDSLESRYRANIGVVRPRYEYLIGAGLITALFTNDKKITNGAT